MENGSDIRESTNEYLFHHLIAMFQTLALQQMGKLVNPITGELERDLQQGRITIDMLQMIKDKTEGNLQPAEKAILDRALTELQMNYVDEMNRPEEAGEEAGEKAGEEDGEETGEEDGEDTEKGAGEEADQPEETTEEENGKTPEEEKA